MYLNPNHPSLPSMKAFRSFHHISLSSSCPPFINFGILFFKPLTSITASHVCLGMESSTGVWGTYQ